MRPMLNQLRVSISALLMPLTLLAITTSGSMTEDETWIVSDSPVMIDVILDISEQAVLTIEPGVTVKFGSNGAIVVQGSLVARGTAEDSIRFTSEVTSPGAWGGIYFRGGWEVTDDNIEDEVRVNSVLAYCVIEYAGSENVDVGSALEITSSSPEFRHSTIRNSRGRSGTIKCGSVSKPIFDNCLIINNRAERGGALSASLGSEPILTNNKFVDNHSDTHGGAIYISLANIDIRNNLFLGNSASAHGGAVYAAVSSSFNLVGNVFIGNKSPEGSNNLYFTKRLESVVKDNVFDSVDSTSVAIYLHQADENVDATGNWWGNPQTFSFKDAIRDRYDSSAEPYVMFDPYLWAPPAVHPGNPSTVDSIALCRDDAFSEQIPRGVAEGAPLRIRLAGQDSNPFYPDIIRILVTSEYDIDGVVIPLRETTANSGIFTGRGQVEKQTDQERFTIGSREGGEVIIHAPFQPEREIVYQTMSPRPYAEELSVELTENVDIMHLVDHAPDFTWGYFDVLEVPQKEFQLEVFPIQNGQPTSRSIWDTGVVRKAVQAVTYSGEELVDGESYQVKVRVKNLRFWSEDVFEIIRMNSLPTTPEALRPIIDELSPTLGPTFAITISTDREGDSLTYEFEVSREEDGEVVVSAQEISAGENEVTWTLTDSLVENVTYHFHARAHDPLENGEWSASRVFHMNSIEEPTRPFDLLEPIDRVSVFLLHPTLKWEEAIDPDPLSSVHYTIEIDKSDDFTSPRVYTDLVDLELLLPDSLDNQSDYYWRVISVDNTDRTTVSSTVGRFSVDTTPSIPVLASPITGEERMSPDALTWEVSTDPNPDDMITYEVEIYNEATFVTVVATAAELMDPIITIEELPGWGEFEDNYVYSWRVRSRDNHDAASEFSDGGSFFFNRYNDAPAPVAEFSLPADTVMGTTDIQFGWEEATDPDLSDPASSLVYDLECSRSGFEGGEIRRFSSEVGVAELVTPLDDNRLWHYRIRTRDDEEALSPWSSISSVLVNFKEDPPTWFTLLQPAVDDQVVELDSVLFTWGASSDPDWESSIEYRFELRPEDGPPIIHETPKTSYMFKGGLKNEARYSWLVTAVDNTGLESECDGVFTFSTTTTPTAPEAAPMPEELMPPDMLKFAAAADPNPVDILSYTLEIASTEAFADVLVHVEDFPHSPGVISTPVDSLAGQEKLNDDADYWFRVMATDNHGYGGQFSEPYQFRFNRTNDTPEPTPGPFSPLSDEVVRDQNPTLTWNASSDGDLSDPPDKLVYELRLDSDGELETSIAYNYASDIGSTMLSIPAALADNTPWVWQVRTRDDDGATSEWSEMMPFLVNIVEDDPSMPVLTNPSEQAKLNMLGPLEFRWQESTDIDYQSSISYRIEYATTIDLADAEIIESINETNLTVEGPLENTNYYWRITAVDNTGLEASSETGTFTLDTRPSVPEPTASAELHELTPKSSLSWSKSVDPDPNDKITYELHIGETLDTPVIAIEGAASLTETQWQMSQAQALVDNRTYSWAVRAVDEHGIASEWCRTTTFFYNSKNDAPNAVPQLNEPATEAEVSVVNISWDAASDNDFSDRSELISYKVELSASSDFKGEIISVSSSRGKTSATVTGLTDDTRWYWHVISIDDEGAEGAPSAQRSFIFNLKNDPPGAIPHFTGPTDGAEIRTVDLTWLAAPDKDLTDTPDRMSYKVELSRDSKFSSGIVIHETNAGQNSASPSGLADDTQWYWRVRAIDDDGAAGPVSSAMSFIYNSGNNPPGKVPSLTSPQDMAVLQQPKLAWSQATDNDLSDPQKSLTYRVQLSRDRGFGAGTIEMTTSPGVIEAVPANLSDNSIWIWRVAAIDDEGAMGEYTEVQRFVLNLSNEAPGRFTLSAPANGSEVVDVQVRLNWTASIDPDPLDEISYKVIIAEDKDFSTGVREFSGLSSTDFGVPADIGAPGETLYWKVVATDKDGLETWGSNSDSSPWSFSIPAAAAPGE